MAKLFPVLKKWIQWWNLQKGQIFNTFHRAGHSGINLAEMGNTGWKHWKPLTLVDACFDNTAMQVRQEEDSKLFYVNESTSRGHAPSLKKRVAKEHKAQEERAAMYIEILGDRVALLSQADELHKLNYKPPKASGFKPPNLLFKTVHFELPV